MIVRGIEMDLTSSVPGRRIYVNPTDDQRSPNVKMIMSDGVASVAFIISLEEYHHSPKNYLAHVICRVDERLDYFLASVNRKKIYIVWNEGKTEGFATTDHQLAYEVRKGATSNCYHEDGTPSVVGMEFANQFNFDNCTIQEIKPT